MKKFKSHHFCSALSFFAGVSFLFERYLLLSPAIVGPVSLLDWVPGPLAPIQVWGVLFLVGSFAIMLSPSPMIRAVFLSFGMASWAVFASGSLYGSLVGASASTSGSLLGIVLFGVVLRFYVAIRDVVVDFTKRGQGASI